MYCQACGARNSQEAEFCVRCHQKLLVVSGGAEEVQTIEAGEDGEAFSLDEHLLERVSVLEEALRRTADSVRQLLSALGKQERNILVNQTGLATLRELLERKQVVGREEWSQLWESKMDYQLLALEKRERFLSLKARIAALYRGDRRDAFLQLLEEAEYALLGFDLPRALGALEEAYKMDRQNHELAFFLGETCFNEGDGATARRYFDRVLELAPEHYEGLVYSGVLAYERGEVTLAQGLLERSIALYPDVFLPHFSLGAVYAGQGRLSRAAALLERAVELDPMTQALYLLGSCYYEMGKLTLAIRTLQRAVRHDPADEEALHLLGLALLDRGWTRKSLEAFRQAERLNPKKLRYRDLVRYLSGQETAPLPGIGDPARQCLARAEAELAGDQPERSLAHYRAALELEPDNPTLLLSFALACLELDRSREAEAIVHKVLDLGSGDLLRATAYATLIEALRSEGRLREGTRLGRRLLEEGRSPFARSIAYYEIACNLAEMEERLDEALDCARRSLEHSPEELRPFPLAAIGWVHYKRREFDQAIELLSRSSEMDPTARTLTRLGLALLASGEKERARSVMARAREIGGREPSVQRKMMECMRDSSRLLERVRGGRREMVREAG